MSGASRTSQPAATTAWNTRHKAALQTNNDFVVKNRKGDVKPRWLEKLSPAYWTAIKRGDTAEAQCIKEKAEVIERRIPILRDAISAEKHLSKGNYQAALSDIANGITETGAAIATKGKSLLRTIGAETAQERLGEGLDWLIQNGDIPTEAVGAAKTGEPSANSLGKHSGKNDKHINLDKKSAAQERYEKKYEEFKKIDSKSRKTHEEVKLRAKLKNQLKHLYKKCKESGETHSRRTKNKKGRRR